MIRTLFVLFFSICVCHADTVDKHTLQTSEYGDEGKFGGGEPGNTNALILWSGDSPSIVRRHRPEGHSKTTSKAFKLWSERSAGGFPVNLKNEDGFCSFLSKIDSDPDLFACICDDGGAWDTGAPFSCTPALTLAQCSPSACLAGTPPVIPPPGDTCTVTDWSPGTDTVCAGNTFEQTRTLADCTMETQTATGIKQCATTCPATDWSPEIDTICQGNSFTQARTLSDCSTDTRIMTGAKNCNRCTVRDWTPAVSSVCGGDTFTQTRRNSDCSTGTRTATGTKNCPQVCQPTAWSPSQSGYCTNDEFTQSRTISDCSTETQDVYGAKHCTQETCRYTTGSWTPGAGGVCNTRTVAQSRTVTIVNNPCAGGSAPSASQTVYGSKDCTLPTCRWTTGPWTGDSPAGICRGSSGAQSRTVTLVNSPCEGGRAPASTQTVSGAKDCTPPCTYRTGSWSPSASSYCDGETFAQTRTVTSSPANCKPGNAPASTQRVSGTKNCEPPVIEPPEPPKPPPPSCTYWTTTQSTGGFLGVLCVPMKNCNGVIRPAGAAYPAPC